MKRIMLTNGDEVICDHCHKRHVIAGMRGNNQGWKDANGWTGIGYDARGFINTLAIQAYCPECDDKGSELRDAENMVSRGLFDTIEKALKFLRMSASDILYGK